MEYALIKPTQSAAERATINALHIAYNEWTEADNTFLVRQLSGYLFGNVSEGDFEEAASHYKALTTYGDVTLRELGDHYDMPPAPELRQIRENEITEDLTASLDRILTNAGFTNIHPRRIGQLVEEFNDIHTVRAAA